MASARAREKAANGCAEILDSELFQALCEPVRIEIARLLIARGRSGMGASIKVSLSDGMADWMTVPLLFTDYGGGAPRRAGLRHPSVAPYNAFASAKTLDRS